MKKTVLLLAAMSSLLLFHTIGIQAQESVGDLGYPISPVNLEEAPFLNDEGYFDASSFLNDYYSERKGRYLKHLGNDWNRADGKDKGQPVLAVDDGNVLWVHNTKETNSWGKILLLGQEHNGQEYCTLSGHVSKIAREDGTFLKKGYTVRQGEEVAEIGDANGFYRGKNCGYEQPEDTEKECPHLHIEGRFECNVGSLSDLGAGINPYADDLNDPQINNYFDLTLFIKTGMFSSMPPLKAGKWTRVRRQFHAPGFALKDHVAFWHEDKDKVYSFTEAVDAGLVHTEVFEWSYWIRDITTGDVISTSGIWRGIDYDAPLEDQPEYFFWVYTHEEVTLLRNWHGWQKFNIADVVKVVRDKDGKPASANMRDTAGGDTVVVSFTGSDRATIVEGPTEKLFNGTLFVWWKVVQLEGGSETGWIAQNWITYDRSLVDFDNEPQVTPLPHDDPTDTNITTVSVDDTEWFAIAHTTTTCIECGGIGGNVIQVDGAWYTLIAEVSPEFIPSGDTPPADTDSSGGTLDNTIDSFVDPPEWDAITARYHQFTDGLLIPGGLEATGGLLVGPATYDEDMGSWERTVPYPGVMFVSSDGFDGRIYKRLSDDETGKQRYQSIIPSDVLFTNDERGGMGNYGVQFGEMRGIFIAESGFDPDLLPRILLPDVIVIDGYMPPTVASFADFFEKLPVEIEVTPDPTPPEQPSTSASTDLLASDGGFYYIPDADQIGLAPTGSFTIEAQGKLYAKPAPDSDTAMVSKYTSGSLRAYSFALLVLDTGESVLRLLIKGLADMRSDPIRFELATWYHLAVVYNADSSTATFYQDGVVVGVAHSTAGPLVKVSSPFEIGARNGKQLWEGSLDEVRFWSTAREDAEIKENKDRSIDPLSPNLEGYWRFDHTGEDATVNANHLSMNGTAVFSPANVPFVGVYDGASETPDPTVPVVSAVETTEVTTPTLLFIPTGAGASLLIFDTDTGIVVDEIPVGPSAVCAAVLPDGKAVYVTSVSGARVWVVDPLTRVTYTITLPALSEPHSVAAPVGTGKVYVTLIGKNSVAVIDTATDIILKTIPVGPTPSGAIARPDGRFVYVTDEDTNSVSVIDTATDTVIVTLNVGAYPIYTAFDNKGFLYVANYRGSSISVIDTMTHQVETIPTDPDPFALAVSIDSLSLWVAHRFGSVGVYERATGIKVATIPIEGGADLNGIVPHPDGSRMHVSDGGTGRIITIDTQTYEVTSTVTSGSTRPRLLPGGVAY